MASAWVCMTASWAGVTPVMTKRTRGQSERRMLLVDASDMPTLSCKEWSRVSREVDFAGPGNRDIGVIPMTSLSWYLGSSLATLELGAIAVQVFRAWVGYDMAVMGLVSRWSLAGSSAYDNLGMMPASISGMHPALMSDALDDLTDAGDPWVAPTANELSQADVNACLESLRANDPASYLALGAMVRTFMKGVSQTAPYQAAPGARDAMRSTLHATGVI